MTQFPFPTRFISCEFGSTDANHPNPHRGTDFAVRQGTAVPSATAGKVVISQWSDVLGNVVVVKVGRLAYFGYCHLLHPGLKVGTIVKAGEPIGLVGSTGSASTGPHLHFTFSKLAKGVFSGKVYDPIKVLTKLIKKEGK